MSLFRRVRPAPLAPFVEEGFSPVGLYVGAKSTVEIVYDEAASRASLTYQLAETALEPSGLENGYRFLMHGMPGGLAQAQATVRELLGHGYVRSEYPTRAAHDHARWLEQNPAADFTPERGRAAYEALLAVRASDPESEGYEERLRKIMLDVTASEDSEAALPGAAENFPGRR